MLPEDLGHGIGAAKQGVVIGLDALQQVEQNGIVPLEEGGTVGEIYRRYFLRRGESGEGEEDANLGLAGLAGGELTPEEIERISRYVSATGKRYVME